LELSQLAKVCASEGLPLANLAMFKAPFTDPIDPVTARVASSPTSPSALTGSGSRGHRDGEVTVLNAVTCTMSAAPLTGRPPSGNWPAAACRAGYALMENLIVEEGSSRHRPSPSI